MKAPIAPWAWSETLSLAPHETVHDGWRLSDCNLAIFQKLKRQRLIMSQGGSPYRITREGLLCLRAQADNRVSGRGW